MPTFTKTMDIEVNDYDVEIEIDVDDFMDEADIDEVIDECIDRDKDQVIDKVIEADVDAVRKAMKEADEILGLTPTTDEPLGEKVRLLLKEATPEDILNCMMLQTNIAVITSTAVRLALTHLSEV